MQESIQDKLDKAQETLDKSVKGVDNLTTYVKTRDEVMDRNRDRR
jgi:hypothetical protein